jgi:putative sterol carrier protein
VKGRAAELHKPPSHEPSVTLKLGAVPFLKLVTGNADGPSLFLSGKLKIEGDLILAARLPGLFEIPRA